MKTKLTITVERDVVPKAKRYARARGVSLSSLVEDALRAVVEPDRPSFVGKWRGRFVPAARDARDFLVDLTAFASVAPADTEALRYAASLDVPDLEHAMQVAAARACGAQYIATRNVKDFRKSPVPARTPYGTAREAGVGAASRCFPTRRNTS